ncbi:MAG: hypothetical protein JXB10_15610 [Pirellulales bacterium]|nr:hypothetical protein [Pirellulales bacterium]
MKRKPRGMTFLELAVAGALLAVLAAVCLKFLAAQVRQRSALAERQTAQCEAANLMEHLAARPYEELSAEKLAGEKPSAQAAALLPGAELKIEVAAAAGPPPGKRITLRLSWPGPDPAAPYIVQLTSWRYPQPPIPNP